MSPQPCDNYDYLDNKPTFNRKGIQLCINHVYSNCHTKVKNLIIEREILSDYRIVTFHYNNKKLSINVTYRIKRNFSLLTRENLLYHINVTNSIDTIYNYTDSNTISEIILNELDNKIETISPSKKI